MVIQNGANSAVGCLVIQMARNMGVKTINIIRDRPNYEILEKELKDLGATVVVKSTLFPQEATQDYIFNTLGLPRPILGFNCVGGNALAEMSRSMATGATIVTYGGMGGKAPSISVSSLIFNDLKYCGFWMSRWYGQARKDPLLEEESNKMFKAIIGDYQAGRIVFNKMETFDFQSAWHLAIQKYTDPASYKSDHKPLLVFEPSK